MNEASCHPQSQFEGKGNAFVSGILTFHFPVSKLNVSLKRNLRKICTKSNIQKIGLYHIKKYEKSVLSCWRFCMWNEYKYVLKPENRYCYKNKTQFFQIFFAFEVSQLVF